MIGILEHSWELLRSLQRPVGVQVVRNVKLNGTVLPPSARLIGAVLLRVLSLVLPQRHGVTAMLGVLIMPRFISLGLPMVVRPGFTVRPLLVMPLFLRVRPAKSLGTPTAKLHSQNVVVNVVVRPLSVTARSFVVTLPRAVCALPFLVVKQLQPDGSFVQTIPVQASWPLMALRAVIIMSILPRWLGVTHYAEPPQR